MPSKILNHLYKTLFFYLLLSIIVSFSGWLLFIKTKRERHILADTIALIYKDINTSADHKDLMLGSSSIANMQADKYLKCGDWLNRGIGSAQLEDIIRYIKLSPLGISPSKIIIYAGENDIANKIGVIEVIEKYTLLIDHFRITYPESEIHILAIKPSPKRQSYHQTFKQANQKLALVSQNYTGVYFHHAKWYSHLLEEYFISDQVHLTSKGYTVFTQGFNSTCKTNRSKEFTI